MYASSASVPASVHDTVGHQTSGMDAGLVGLLQPETGSTSIFPASTRAAYYHVAGGGQRIRFRLALDAGRALGLKSDDSVCIATAVELLHNASLIHDDLQDQDKFRRGRPSVWAAFGEDIAICSGDLLLSAAYAALATFSSPELLPGLISLVHARTAKAIAGQCADLEARGQTVDNVEAYETIAIAKSGALLGLPLELALVASGYNNSSAVARGAADAFAVGYQIFDDIADFGKDAGTRKAGPDARPASLNILSVLRAAGHGADAGQLARTLGLKHLCTAADAAANLPKRSGDLLRELAMRLAAGL
jgi:geranylgeranyl pyrophosphate synthase